MAQNRRPAAEDINAEPNHLMGGGRPARPQQDNEVENITESLRGLHVQEQQPEPRTRDDFLRVSTDITLDPNTAHRRLLLSYDGKKVTLEKEDQPYPDHPDRFTHFFQVLSKESLPRRCYWEVKLKGDVHIAVSYKSIRRSGDSHQCWFGFNNNSWDLNRKIDRYVFWYNKKHTDVEGARAPRVGVYLDHDAGILSFYSVSAQNTMTLLHRVQTTFTEPLYAGFWIHEVDSAATLWKLNILE